MYAKSLSLGASNDGWLSRCGTFRDNMSVGLSYDTAFQVMSRIIMVRASGRVKHDMASGFGSRQGGLHMGIAVCCMQRHSIDAMFGHAFLCPAPLHHSTICYDLLCCRCAAVRYSIVRDM